MTLWSGLPRPVTAGLLVGLQTMGGFGFAIKGRDIAGFITAAYRWLPTNANGLFGPGKPLQVTCGGPTVVLKVSNVNGKLP